MEIDFQPTELKNFYLNLIFNFNIHCIFPLAQVLLQTLIHAFVSFVDSTLTIA